MRISYFYYSVLLKIGKLLAGSIAFVFVFGITISAYAGNGLPPINMAQVQDNGNIVDLEIWASFEIPDPAFSPSGYGVITGLNGGNPALAITTSHSGVCDSPTQTLIICEGLWHQHHAVLVADPLCDNLSGTKFRIQHLSFESPGVTTPPGGTEHISFWDVPRSEMATDAIDGTLPQFQFGTIDPVQALYQAVKFDIAVIGGLDANGFPNVNQVTGLREACVFNVEFADAPNDPKVGGEFLGVNTAALLIAGAQMNAAWILPVIVSAIGIGIVIARKF